WLVKGTSTDDVFKAFELNMAGSRIFENPKFVIWALYVTKVEKRNPEEIILSKLMTRFDAYSLPKMLIEAEKVSTMKAFATSLQTQQRQVCLSGGKFTNSVYKLLKLDETWTDLFTSPQFFTWTSYVDAFNRRNREQLVSILRNLTTYYDDATLSMMLEATMKVSTTKQLKYWLTIRKPASKVFETMKLTNGDNLFTNPKFLVWLTYVDDFNNINPREAKSAASVLAAHFGNAGLSKILNAAMKDEATMAVAFKLQGQRLETWKKSNIHPLDVLELLNLEWRGILANPLLASWIRYMADFNARNPTKQLDMIDILSLYIKNDGRLAELLEAGRKVPATKQISVALQYEWFAKWESMRFTPSDAFKAVGLKGIYEATGPLLSDPALNFWVRYMNEFNRKHPTKKTSLIDTLRQNYHDEAILYMITAAKTEPTTKLTAENLEVSLLTKWVLEKKNPAVVARWYGADKSGAIYEKYRAKYISRWSDRA
ncbi:RxLR effector protein, partial [Phytophthora megakarya]